MRIQLPSLDHDEKKDQDQVVINKRIRIEESNTNYLMHMQEWSYKWDI